MRLQGRLTEWDDAGGFGYITSLGDQSRILVYVSEFPDDKRRPIATDLLTYEVGRDERGEPRATAVLFMTPTSPKRSHEVSKASGIGSRPLVLILGLLLVAATIIGFATLATSGSHRPNAAVSTSAASDDVFAAAFRNQTSGLAVKGQGVVTRVLSDDNSGSRHQRFILRLPSGQTLLMAHNIDVAPRLVGLAVGDTVSFSGVYEWNAEGGVVHWTHRDPGGTHAAGWLKHNGQTSQ